METSLLICGANQWISFYMIGTSVMKELRTLYTLENRSSKFGIRFCHMTRNSE